MTREVTETKTDALFATRGDMKGEIDLQWEPGSRFYVLQMCIDGRSNSKWRTVDIVTKSIYKISGLKSGAHYRFRVAGVNSNTQRPWSNEISISAP